MSEELVHKVTLSTGKVVLLKPMKIKYQNLAIQAVGKKAGDNQNLAGALIQTELLKILITQVDGKPLNPKEMEDLDSVFDYNEYQQLLKVLNKLAGGEHEGELVTETVSIGSP
jgi:hypothetical protein